MKPGLILIAALAIFLMASVPYTLYRTEPAMHGTGTDGSQTASSEAAQTQDTSTDAPPSLLTITITGTMGGAVFAPADVTVSVGATVTWLNPDTDEHTVTSYNSTVSGGPLFDSGNLLSGQSFSYTFLKPGVYPYHCIYHDWMYGVVVVRGTSA